jgi:cytochrome c oxidase assembly protein subunit 11
MAKLRMSKPDVTLANAAAAKGIRRTAIACAAFAASMVGVAFASVPLYDLFCKVTGFDGTPLTGSRNASKVMDDAVDVRFDVNVAPGIPWRFVPEVPKVEAKLGETKTVFFKVTNTGATPSTGIATFNVQPPLVGGYFVKIQCFCFNEQTLQPGETMDFPVVFYVEPSLRQDANVRDLREVTLSYTYFPSKNSQPVVVATGAKPSL